MINVSDIQRFSLGDGPGIRTTIFFQGCNLHCPWCHNPEAIPLRPQKMRDPRGRERVYGAPTDIANILAVVEKDAAYYAESGGGVTLSGGEVLLQAEGAARLAAVLQAEGIHVLLDTAGDVPFAAFQKVLPFIDAIYYDWKAANAEDYRQRIGGDFARILDNLGRLIEAGCAVRVRVPLIEGVNTAPDYAEQMCACLRQVGAQEVDLLPFHRLGSAKYRALGLAYAYASVPSMTIQRAKEIAKIYQKYFKTKIEG